MTLRFVGASDDQTNPSALIWGLGADGGVSFRAGASEGPRGIREFSDSIETWSQDLGADLEDLRVVDVGDYTGDNPAKQAAEHLETGALLVTFGGDHAITPPVVRAAAHRYPDLVVIGFDAHLDLRHTYIGEHACTFRRVVEMGLDIHLLGIRSGERAEWEDAPKVLASCSPDVVVTPELLRSVGDRPVYLSIDIDVFDPSEAPGTGTLEAGGTNWFQMKTALDQLASLNVVAFDIVEVAPPLDPSGVTQALAAKLTRENILRFARR